MPDYQQSHLWDEPGSPTRARAPRRAAGRRGPAAPAPAPLPLWSLDQPPPEAPEAPAPAPAPPAPTPPAPGAAPATSALPASAAAPPVPARPRPEPVSPARPRAPAPAAGTTVRAAPKLAPGRVARPPAGGSRPAAGLGGEAMEAAAEWVEGLLEEVGQRAPTLRAFVRAFPPQPRWGEPWLTGRSGGPEPPPFAPDAASYAAALREAVAGRRRLRLDGWWVDGRPGAVVAVARSALGQDAPDWEIGQTIGLED